jgi:tetratricopeptide (TPR) repeat protein
VRGIRIVALAAAGTLASIAVAVDGGSPEERVTFNRDVAPILFRSCAPCHRPGGAGPFPLLSYADARERARQIVRVTQTRFMPPWLPDAGAAPFAGDRRLDVEEVERIRRWLADGAIEGEASDLPDLPTWPARWALGTPDLVVDLPAPYALAAEGLDEYRNFVLPSRVGGTAWVEAVELSTTSPRVVHHARLFADRTRSSRRADAEEPGPGFAGMVPASARNPDGILVGWTPGKVPVRGGTGLAWRIDDATDLVLQLHMVPSGRPEEIGVSLGLYFAAAPPALRSVTLLLGSRDIDLPPGAAGVEVASRYRLPVDVALVGLYPHAHYLAREMTVAVEPPDGPRAVLLHIPEWDFNWQDEYRFTTPVVLDAGAVVSMEYVYDNTTANPRNPHAPPRRVTYGARTTDEMAELALQVVPRDPRDVPVLEADHERWTAAEGVAYRERRLERDPDDFESHVAAASGCLVLGRVDDAIVHLRAAVRLRPGDATAWNNLGFALRRAGDTEEAIDALRRAAQHAPDLAVAQRNLAQALDEAGRPAEALEHYERAVRLDPDSAEAHAALGHALHVAGRNAEALGRLEDAARLAPDAPEHLRNLAWVLSTTARPGDVAIARAVELAERAAARSARRDPSTLRVLAAVYSRAGRPTEAIAVAREAIAIAPPGDVAEALGRDLERYEQEARRAEGR